MHALYVVTLVAVRLERQPDGVVDTTGHFQMFYTVYATAEAAEAAALALWTPQYPPAEGWKISSNVLPLVAVGHTVRLLGEDLVPRWTLSLTADHP
jgi:hypothetical protein